MKRKVLAVLTMSTILALTPALAGVVFEVETTYHSGSPRGPESSEMSVEEPNLKMEVAPREEGGTRGEAIYRSDRREVVIVDHDDQSYVVMDEEALAQIAGQVGAAMGMMQEALKNVPESERRKIEEMMKQRMPSAAQAPGRPTTELRDTGERATKNGYPCRKYEVWRDGRKIRELWVTDWGNLEGGAEMENGFREMAKFMRELMKKLTDGLPGGGGLGGPGDDTIFEHFEEMDGFPVVTRGFGDDGSLEDESTLRSTRRRTLDPDEFEPPAGYKRRTMLGAP